MTTANKLISNFDEDGFVLRHKTEAENMFELLDHLLSRHNVFDLALDVGGGYGDHLPFLSRRIDTIFVMDIIDYLVDDAFSPSNVANRSGKFGGTLDLTKISFHKCDAHTLLYREKLFDFVFSINAFEHIPNPALAFAEILRVTQNGSPMYIQFDPIWNSPAGHHLPHLNLEPWSHILLNKEDFASYLTEMGATSEDFRVFETAMNRKSFAYYKSLFTSFFAEAFELKSFVSWGTDPKDEPACEHANFDRCLARGYSVEEIITRGVQFVGIKK